MKTTYPTTILGFGNHAAIEIPDKNLAELGANKRAPLKITVNGYTYQSTATAVDGKCLVVFPTRDRVASGLAAGDTTIVTLELDTGYREVVVPQALQEALAAHNLSATFHDLTYSRRKEYARLVNEANAEATRERRLQKIMSELQQLPN